MQPSYVQLVDLRTGRIKGEAVNACCLTFATGGTGARPPGILERLAGRGTSIYVRILLNHLTLGYRWSQDDHD